MSVEPSESASPRSLTVVLKRWIVMLSVSVVAATAMLAGVAFTELGREPQEAFAQIPANVAFDLRSAIVDQKHILSGGPPKDGIPALTRPAFITAEQADYLQSEDRVIGVKLGEVTRAYPLAILNYHEIVNDRLGETPFAVTYCPLCDSAAVFDRRTPLGEREFGVSGLLYNSNVLMYDRGGKPESLWSQVRTTGISGPGAKRFLTALPCELTTWSIWKRRFPKTLVLSSDTGHPRDYRRNPYADYFTNQQLMFPVTPVNNQLPNKERVLGAWAGNQFRAYPESRFSAEKPQITDRIGGKQITVEYDSQAGSLRIAQADEGVAWLYSFWFAWYALHPDTSVFGEVSAQEEQR